MPVCPYCKEEFVWKKAENGEWRPHVADKFGVFLMHNCQAFWAADGHKMTDKELADHYQDYLAGQKEMEKQAMENDRCPACDGGGCSECDGTGDYEPVPGADE